MGNIVSIHSYRGGTGKSNLTANVASQLAVMGRKVAVIDTDIQSPGIHILFGLDETKMGHTLNEFLHGQCSIEEVAFPVGEHVDDAPGRSQLRGKHLWLIPSSMNLGEISRILKDGYDVNILNRGIQTLRKQLGLDFLLIDTHPGLNEETLLSVAISDAMIIIMRPDQQDFQGTAVTVDVAQSLDVKNLMIVVNKALKRRYSFAQLHEDVESKYGVKVAGILPLSEDMVDLGSGDIFSLVYPDHEWSATVRGVAQALDALP